VNEQSFANETVLQGDVTRRATDRKGFIPSPGSGYVIEDHRVARGDANAIGAAVTIDAFTKPHVPADCVIGIGERNVIAVNRDTSSRGGLAGDGDIGLHREGRIDLNDTADIENHRAVGRAHRVAEGARAGVVEVGHVIDRAAAAAHGVGTETFGTGKSRNRLKASDGQQYCAGRKDTGAQQGGNTQSVHGYGGWSG
jgi:hypothetical protein